MAKMLVAYHMTQSAENQKDWARKPRPISFLKLQARRGHGFTSTHRQAISGFTTGPSPEVGGSGKDGGMAPGKSTPVGRAAAGGNFARSESDPYSSRSTPGVPQFHLMLESNVTQRVTGFHRVRAAIVHHWSHGGHGAHRR